MPLENDEASGALLTGSTFSGYPQTVGGVYYGSGSAGALPAYVTSIQTDISGAQYITTSGSLPVVGTLGIISGTITANAVIQNWPAVIGVSGTFTSTPGPTNVYTSGLQGISGTVSAVIQNWPLTLGVSGTVALSNNPPTNVYTSGLQGVSGTVFVTQTGSIHVTVDNQTTVAQPLQVWNQGSVGVSGTVGSVIQNWPAIIGVSGTFTSTPGPTNVYTSGLQGVSGTVIANAVIQNWPAIIGVSGTFTSTPGPTNVYTSGLQGISGGIVIQNEPLVTAVSGSQLTGSTFAGFPVVMGGVYSGSQYAVTAFHTDINGAQYITTTGSLPVVGTLGIISGTITANAVIQNWPAVIGVSGSLSGGPTNVYTSGLQGVSGTVTANVTVTGSTGLMVAAPPGAPVWITGSVFVDNSSGGGGGGSVTQGTSPWIISVTSSLPVSAPASAPVWVTGSVFVDNQSATSVAGGSITGSTFSGFPISTGGVYSGSQFSVTAFRTDISGAQYVTTSGSIPVVGTLGIISGTITANAVIQNWPAVSAVTGTLVTGSTAQGNPLVIAGVWFPSGTGANQSVNLVQPAYIRGIQTNQAGIILVSVTGSLPTTTTLASGVPTNVYTSGLQGVSGSITTNAGAALTGSIFNANGTFDTLVNIAASSDSGVIDSANSALVAVQWAMNNNAHLSTQFTGSISVQGSCDNVIWIDLSRSPVTCGPGANSVSGITSGTYANSAFYRWYRLDIAYTGNGAGGSGCNLSSSYVLKG
jgi:hypothetical protein